MSNVLTYISSYTCGFYTYTSSACNIRYFILKSYSLTQLLFYTFYISPKLKNRNSHSRTHHENLQNTVYTVLTIKMKLPEFAI